MSRKHKRNNNNRKSNHFDKSQQSGFNKPKYFSTQNRGSFRIKTLSNNPALFIKKAEQIQEIEYDSANTFADFKFVSPLQNNISRHGYTNPTPIQDQTIKPILEGRDVIGLAATGTGKTAAFLLPLIHKMFTTRQERTLIIAPTRELASQINDEFKQFSFGMRLYSALVIGGASMNKQIFEVRRNPHVLIATPGRLKDLVERQIVDLRDYSNIVLDEVDLMVDIGFIRDIKFFISLLPKDRQSLFFSATISPKIQEILETFVTNPVTISVKKQETSENVDQDVIHVKDPSQKIEQLHDLLIKDGFEKVLIFGRTKHGVDKLNKQLTHRGFKIGTIHGNKSQNQRLRVLESFKKNEISILLATDVASRGLDINNVTHVINYELPESYEDYVHRIGRTGRAGNKGFALTFID
jgi:superfamily II DNA/RNA helicase